MPKSNPTQATLPTAREVVSQLRDLDNQYQVIKDKAAHHFAEARNSDIDERSYSLHTEKHNQATAQQRDIQQRVDALCDTGLSVIEKLYSELYTLDSPIVDLANQLKQAKELVRQLTEQLAEKEKEQNVVDRQITNLSMQMYTARIHQGNSIKAQEVDRQINEVKARYAGKQSRI